MEYKYTLFCLKSIYLHKQHMQYRNSGTRPWAAHHVGSWRHIHELPRMLNPINRWRGSVSCSNCCLQKKSPNCPVNTRLGGFHSTTKSLTWIIEYSVTLLCVEMQCVRHMYISDWVVRTSASHWGSPGFKCGSQLPRCKILVAILSFSRQMAGQCLNLENECFLLYYFEFIIHWPS
jgi:hypothetical protein